MTTGPGKLSVVPFQNAEPDQDLIADIEQLLEEAKRGEVIAFAYAITKPDGTVATGWVGHGNGARHSLYAGVNLLSHRYAAAMIRENDE